MGVFKCLKETCELHEEIVSSDINRELIIDAMIRIGTNMVISDYTECWAENNVLGLADTIIAL